MSNQINQADMLGVGTTLRGTYRIERYLSSGGFGNTYVATHVGFGERVAIKEFFINGVAERANDGTTVSVSNDANKELFASQLEKFRKEARRIRSLKNDHIVRVHDLFDENGTAYYVMDYVDGESLAERMRRLQRPLTESEVMKLYPQMLDALQTVHREGILHLDLKPGNMMIDARGVVRLIDFGASKQQSKAEGERLMSTALICYTDGYAPREQMERNFEKIGPWTDLYALGATLYALLTRRHPPMPSDIDDDRSADKHLALPLPEGVTAQMRALILRLMQTDRHDRPQSVEELLAPVDPAPEVVSGGAKSEETKVKGVGERKKVSAKEALALGNYYFIGRKGKSRDYAEALKWYRMAAEQGDADAQNNLGVMYECGYGVDRDLPRARYWYKKAVEQGDEFAKANLKRLEMKKESRMKSRRASPGFFSKHAKTLFLIVLAVIGLAIAIYYFAIPRAESPSVGMAPAAEVTKAYYVGKDYYYGRNGKAQDYAEAAKWFSMAAEKGEANAQIYLGVMYENGEGVTQDYSEAMKWYRKAAEKGEAVAQFNLGLMYNDGKGVDQDYAEALKWYRMAAEQGNAGAQNNLGVMYEKGYGVAQDDSLALYWYYKAAEQGDEDARGNLERLNAE